MPQVRPAPHTGKGNMSILQPDLHQQLRAESLATRQRLMDLVRPLDAARLSERPEPKGWSVAEVLEHLCVTHEVTSAAGAAAGTSARADAGAPAREWRPSFLGKLIAGALVSPRKTKAPKAFQIGPTPRSAVVETLHDYEVAFLQSMDDAASLDWRAVKVRLTALPFLAPRINLGDGFRIHVVHVTRHTNQIERVISKL